MVRRAAERDGGGFSALQRAENSSILTQLLLENHRLIVSVLFSEPKIPQSEVHPETRTPEHVSVLFSEPKIPQ